MIHRCALASAGKWLTIRAARRADHLGAHPEPHLIAEARWMAQQLGAALLERDDRVVWPLIDSGGPRWTLAYDHYLALSPRDQTLVLADLEHLAVTTATALLDMACDDGWEDIQTEVSDPFARLAAYTAAEKRASNWRIDLLAHRGRRGPVVGDLKTGADLPDVATLVAEVADGYGREVAAIHGSRITCRVLGVSFAGDVQWSDPVVV